MSYQRPYETAEGKQGKDPHYYEIGSSVLKNKLGITDPQKAAEEETSAQAPNEAVGIQDCRLST